MGTLAIVKPAGINTLTGAVAQPGLLEFTFTLNPFDGACELSNSVTLCVSNPLIVIAGGTKVRDADTCTAWLAEL